MCLCGSSELLCVQRCMMCMMCAYVSECVVFSCVSCPVVPFLHSKHMFSRSLLRDRGPPHYLPLWLHQLMSLSDRHTHTHTRWSTNTHTYSPTHKHFKNNHTQVKIPWGIQKTYFHEGGGKNNHMYLSVQYMFCIINTIKVKTPVHNLSN